MLLAPFFVLGPTLIINRNAERIRQIIEKIYYGCHPRPIRLFIGDRAILMEPLRHGQDLDVKRGFRVIDDANGILFQIKILPAWRVLVKALALRVMRRPSISIVRSNSYSPSKPGEKGELNKCISG